MCSAFTIKRTHTDDTDFQCLVQQLDHELWNELKEDQAVYDQYNKVPAIQTAVIIYQQQMAVAIGCFKKLDSTTAEVKRMFVKKEYRGKGLSRMVLQELENWAKTSGFQTLVLETSIHFTTARQLYTSSGYTIIPNYPPYTELAESVCMQKHIAS